MMPATAALLPVQRGVFVNVLCTKADARCKTDTLTATESQSVLKIKPKAKQNGRKPVN